MADISMCKGGNCLLKLNCYRYTADFEPFGQTYFSEPPYKMQMMLDENDVTLGVVTLSCIYFWNNEQYKKDEKKSKNK